MKIKKNNFITHLNDLKYHFFLYCYILFQIILIIYYYNFELIYILIKPLLYLINLNYFIFTDITELFLIKIFITFYFSLFLSFFFLIFQVWFFLSKGLFKNENIKIIKYLIIFIFFSYFYNNIIIFKFIIPFSWNFFIKYEKTSFLYSIQLEPKIFSYLFFIIKIIIFSNFIAQLPFFILLLFLLKIISINIFFKFRKLIYLLILIFSTLISPPDIFSQCFITLIIIFIIENLIFFKFFYKRI